MKARGAVVVTLLTLLLICYLLTNSCAHQAEDMNLCLEQELKQVRRLAVSVMGGLDNEARVIVLKNALLRDSDVACGLYDSDGAKLYTARIFLTDPSLSDFTEIANDKDVCRLGDDRKAIYAIHQFDDGVFLILSVEQKTTGQVLLANKLIVLACAVMIVLGVYLTLLSVNAYKKDEVYWQIVSALDAFTDSMFTKRIEPLKGNSQDVQKYNRVLDRLQDRVLRQTSRNNAMNMVMSQMQNGIIAVDENMSVILVTQQAKKLLGIYGNPEGKPIQDASNNVKLDEVFEEAMKQNNGMYTNEVPARTVNGRGHRSLRLYVSVMYNDEGKIAGVLAIVEDITEKRYMEEAHQNYLANVSHEMKTPLTTIIGFTETLQNGPIEMPEQANRFLDIIRSESERMLRLINDVLTVAKLENGNAKIVLERLRLDEMALSEADKLSIRAEQGEVTINCMPAEKPVYIKANQDRVKEILINLIENAIKYNKHGGSVTVQVFSDENSAYLSVSDTGIGIAEDDIGHLFERFFRVDKGRSRKMGGTGLGLAIVKSIITSMNGTIEVHSVLNEGTEFLVTLPKCPDDEAEVTVMSEDSATDRLV